jgi:hypothetical protein
LMGQREGVANLQRYPDSSFAGYKGVLCKEGVRGFWGDQVDGLDAKVSLRLRERDSLKLKPNIGTATHVSFKDIHNFTMGVASYNPGASKYHGQNFVEWVHVPDTEQDLHLPSLPGCEPDGAFGWWPVVAVSLSADKEHKVDRVWLVCVYQAMDDEITAWECTQKKPSTASGSTEAEARGIWAVDSRSEGAGSPSDYPDLES